jgi:outer membrane protein assembly factor BamB
MSCRTILSPARLLRATALGAVLLTTAAAAARDWPQWLGEHRDGVWRETGLVARFPRGGPPVLWRTPVGPGYSGPAVVGDRLYLMDRPPAPAAGQPGRERVLCLRATDGKLLWKDEYPCTYRIGYGTGPRTTPLVHDGKVYTLGAMGNLRCLDALTGRLIWSKDFVARYHAEVPAWGWAASPLLDGDLLYCLVGGEDSAVVAFHKDTGREVWKALTSEEVCYSPPVLIEAGGKCQLIVWLSDTINSLDPATGRLYWKQKYPATGPPQRPAVNISTPRREGDLLFFTSAYHGPMMLELDAHKPAARLLWHGKSNRLERPDGLHCLICTPVLKGGYVYGVGFNGELRSQEARTGKQLWQTYAPVAGKKADSGTAFLIEQGDRFVLFNDHGDLILARLTPRGYHEIDRAHILEPVQAARGRDVVWSHPAFARRCVFARNDKEVVCVSLAAGAAGAGATAKAGGTDVKAPDPHRRPAAAEDAPEHKDLDRKALDLVRRATDLFRNAKSLHVEVELVTRVKQGDRVQVTRARGVYQLEKPNRFAYRVRLPDDARGGAELVCDGKKLCVHSRRRHEYTEADAPDDLAGVGRALSPFSQPITGMLFQNLLSDEPYEVLTDGVSACSYAGDGEVDGTPAHHLKFEQLGMRWELWVAARGKPVVLKASSTQPLGNGETTTEETYRGWKVDMAPAKAAFAFDPQGAKKVKYFRRAPPPPPASGGK